MRTLPTLLVLGGLAATASAQPATHSVSVRLDYDGGDKTCFVASVTPSTVEADPGDKVEWTATDASGQCGGRSVKLANFKLKGSGASKDPVPGCGKDMTAGGPALRCTVNNASRGETFKYDVELPGGRGIDPEIRIRN
jgi:hypothetical protein